MKVKYVIVVALAWMVSACDLEYGVRRSAPIQTDPTPECVEQVLRSTAGIATVEHQQMDGGRPLTLSGIQAPTIVQSFFYQGPDHVRGVLQYTKDYDGRLVFWQSNLGLNQVPPQEEVTATRPVMRRIELALEIRCGLVGLASHVTEWCKRETCAPLQ